MSDIDFVEIQRQIRKLQVQLDRLRTVDATAGGGGAPSGPAGGVLSGTYPDPGFAEDMATQAELDDHAALTTTAHGGILADYVSATDRVLGRISSGAGEVEEIPMSVTAGVDTVPRGNADGVLNLEWVLIKQSVAVATTRTVYAGHSVVLAGPFTNDGTLIINGTMAVI